MRSLKRTILAAALLLSFSAAGATLGNDVSAASLQAAEPAGPVSNTGRDYRIALINAENTRGPVIHKPLKEEKENPSRPRDVKDAGEGSAYREGAPSLRRHDREERQNLEEHRQHRFHKDDSDKGHRFYEHHQRRFDKDDNDRDHRFYEHRQHRFDKEDNDRDHRFDEHRQHRFDKGKDPGRADPAAVTMTGAKEDQPFRSRKMPDSDEAMIHRHRLIS